MGNSRDFGTMLLFSWSCYQRYRGGELAQGRPYKYISCDMIKDSIKNDGTKKLSNITDNSSVMKLWTELNHFCVSKRSRHFAILETTQNMQLLNNKYFSELIYHGLNQIGIKIDMYRQEHRFSPATPVFRRFDV